MRIGVTFLTAFRALRRNKMRSMLTALGIIIGVGAVIAMVGIGNGAKSQVEAQIASMGDNVMLIFSGSVDRGGKKSGIGGASTLTVEDALAIQREVPHVEMITPEVTGNVRVAFGNQNWSTRLNGVSPEYFDIRRWVFAHGVPFTERDVTTSAKVAVMGTTVANLLFGSRDLAMGQVVRLKGVPFTIIGVLEVKGASFLGNDQDDTIIIPYTSAMKRVLGVKGLPRITLSIAKGESLTVAQAQVDSLLMERHRITKGREPDFIVRSQEEIANMATATSKVMTLLLGAIASVSLIVGGIGIMNIMLVSVTERTREIGIRLAIGARGSDILLQFLIEAITLSSLGGLIGILLGLGTGRLVSHFAGWPVVITPGPVIFAFAFSAVVGVFFGFYPARKAAALDPIDALRYE